jgi:CRP/FNR family cyclic AMP-dependent transcriptional regulator
MDREAINSVLERNSWFASLPAELREGIGRVGHVRRVKDAMIYAVGDEANGLFAVLSGKVRISHSSSNGRLALLLVATPGSWFGETSMLDGRQRYSDALAIGRTSLLHLNPAAFREIAHSSPEHYSAFVRLLCDHHRLAMDHITGSGRLPVRSRVAQRLLFFASSMPAPDKPGSVVNLSQDQLASAVGVSRQTLSAVLQRFKDQGIVSLKYRSIELKNRNVLLRYARGA